MPRQLGQWRGASDECGGTAGCQLADEGVLGEAAGGIREEQSEGNTEGRVRSSRRSIVLVRDARGRSERVKTQGEHLLY